MPNDLPLPDDLNILIEKRESDRRSVSESNDHPTDRRTGNERRQPLEGDHAKALRPGEEATVEGIYQCKNCNAVVQVNVSSMTLPACLQCGNRNQPWYELVTKI